MSLCIWIPKIRWLMNNNASNLLHKHKLLYQDDCHIQTPISIETAGFYCSRLPWVLSLSQGLQWIQTGWKWAIMITSSHFFCFSVLQTFLNNCSVSGIFLGAGWSTVEQCIIIAFIETYFLMNDSYYRTELCNIGYIFKKWERREQNKKKEF